MIPILRFWKIDQALVSSKVVVTYRSLSWLQMWVEPFLVSETSTATMVLGSGESSSSSGSRTVIRSAEEMGKRAVLSGVASHNATISFIHSFSP